MKKRSLRIRNKHNTGTSKLKRLDKKNNPIDDQIYFSDSEATTPSSKQGKRKTKIHLSTNQYVYIIGINQ